jgi:uncharacterized protein (DUF2164 family)
MAIKLKKENEERLLSSIQHFFYEQLDTEIGMLKSQLVLDFCLKELGPSIYNQAIFDAQTHMQERIAELDISCHEPEFCYWTK